MKSTQLSRAQLCLRLTARHEALPRQHRASEGTRQARARTHPSLSWHVAAGRCTTRAAQVCLSSNKGKTQVFINSIYQHLTGG